MNDSKTATAYKFTTDGRKVAIIGKLNDAETIVQEVFVTEGGNEIPSGENFVVKSLHDEPVQSWKEKKCADIEGNLTRLGAELSSLSSKVCEARRGAQAHAKALREFTSNASVEQLSTLEAFVSGEITHLVIYPGYSAPLIRPFSEAIEEPQEYDRDNIRLLSLFGKTNGDLEWRLNRYSDGSGGASSRVFPARSYEDAVSIVQDLYDEKASEWMGGKNNSLPSSQWKQRVAEVTESFDVIEARAAKKEQQRQERILKLETELAKLRGQ